MYDAVYIFFAFVIIHNFLLAVSIRSRPAVGGVWSVILQFVQMRVCYQNCWESNLY